MRDVKVLHIPVTTGQSHTQSFVVKACFQWLYPRSEAKVVVSISVALGRNRILPSDLVNRDSEYRNIYTVVLYWNYSTIVMGNTTHFDVISLVYKWVWKSAYLVDINTIKPIRGHHGNERVCKLLLAWLWGWQYRKSFCRELVRVAERPATNGNPDLEVGLQQFQVTNALHQVLCTFTGSLDFKSRWVDRRKRETVMLVKVLQYHILWLWNSVKITWYGCRRYTEFPLAGGRCKSSRSNSTIYNIQLPSWCPCCCYTKGD